MKDEVPAVDTDRHVGERHHFLDLTGGGDVNTVERRRRRYDQHRGEGAGADGPLDHRLQRSVGQDVGVVGQEVLVVAEVLADTPQPLADGRLHAGVDERDGPVGDVGPHQRDLAAAEDEVVRQCLAVVEEVVLDLLRAVAQAEDEFPMAVVGVVLHDVP